MNIKVKNYLTNVRNYVIQIDMSVTNIDQRRGFGVSFGFPDTSEAPLSSDRQIGLTWEGGTIGSYPLLPCGTANDFSQLWTHVVDGKVCRFRFFVQKHRLAGVTVSYGEDTAIFAAEDRTADFCNASKGEFVIDFAEDFKNGAVMVVKDYTVFPLEDCTVGMYRGVPPREKRWYDDSADTVYPVGTVLHSMDFSKCESVKESGYFLTNDSSTLYAGVENGSLRMLTGDSCSYLMLVGNAIPQHLSNYRLRLRFRFYNQKAILGFFHGARLNLEGKLAEQFCRLPMAALDAKGLLNGFEDTAPIVKHYGNAVQKREWITATYICKNGLLSQVLLQFCDGDTAIEEQLTLTDPIDNSVGEKGIFLGAASAVEIAEIELRAGDGDVEPIYPWPAQQECLVRTVYQTPTSCRSYQLGKTENGWSVLRLIGLVNMHNPEMLIEGYGFSVIVKARDGGREEKEYYTQKPLTHIPSADAYLLDPVCLTELDREYAYASCPIVFDPLQTDAILVKAFAVRKDGVRVEDAEQRFTVRNGEIVSDARLLKSLYCEEGYVLIPPYRESGFDYLRRSDYSSYHVLVEDTTVEEYEAYLQKIEEQYGFVRYNRREVKGNLFAAYTNGKANLFINYIAYQKSVRIASDSCRISMMPPLTVSKVEAVTTPQLTQINACHCFLFRMSDGRFIIHDGGMDYEKNHKTLFAQLQQQNVLQGKPVIAAWLFSHMHNDHVGSFIQFKKFADQVELQHVVWNIPSYDTITVYGQRIERTQLMRDQIPMVKETVANYFPNAQIVIPHAGQVMCFGDVKIEVLYSHEDLMPTPITESNNTSTVYRIEIAGQRIAMLGDLHHVGSDVVYKMYGNDGAIQCDILQVAHHGYGGGALTLYAALRSDTALWTSSIETVLNLHLYNRPDVFDPSLVKENLLMGNADSVMLLPLPHKVGSAPTFERRFPK